MLKQKSKEIFSIIFVVIILTLLSCKEGPTKPPEEIKPLSPPKESKWEPIGLQNEDIWRVKADPINSSIIYAASKSNFSAGTHGRIFKTINGGTNWDTLLGGVSVTCFAIDPKNTKVVYVGTSFANSTRPGILKTIDGGNNWVWSDSGIGLSPETGVTTLAIDPKSTNIIYAGTGGFFGGVLYKSSNGGLTWKYCGDSSSVGSINDVEVSRMNSKVIFASTISGGSIIRSTDGGANWSKILTASSVGALSLELWNPGEVFIDIKSFPDTNYYLWKSTNLGETWSIVSDTLALIFDPTKKGFMYTDIRGVDRVLWSSNYGKNWQPLSDSLRVWKILDISKDGKYLFGLGTDKYGLVRYQLK